MKKVNVRLAVVVALLFSVVSVSAQDSGQDLGSIMRLLGVDAPEDLEEHEVEQFSALLNSPLEINRAGLSRLVSSGLFTRYQAASLVDYRSAHGDVLSLSELAGVDGFSQERALALAPFISLRSSALVGQTSDVPTEVHNDLTIRSSSRRVGSETDYNYGLKYRFSVDDRFQLGLSLNRAYGADDASPEAGSFYLAYYGRKQLGKVVVGDYRLRYGQGLALWSGFRTESISSPESFYCRPSGISPYWSYSGDGAYRGVAADFSVGRVTVSSSLAVNGLREIMMGEDDTDLSLTPAVNIGWFGRNAQIGVTGYCTTSALNSTTADSGTRAASWTRAANGTGVYDRAGTDDETRADGLTRAAAATRADGLTRAAAGSGMDDVIEAGACSVDFRWCLRGTDIFGEFSQDFKTWERQALLGTVFKASESLNIALRGTYSEAEYRFAVGGRFSGGKSLKLAGKDGFGSSVSLHTGTFGAEWTWFPDAKYSDEGPDYQLKLQANYSYQLRPDLALAFRVSQRLRSAGEKSRTEARIDLKYSDGPWNATFRFNALYNVDFAMLSYVEGGWKPGTMSVYLRAGVFRIDNWADRIYAYERDAPGNYNVPAYYGRGIWGAFTAGFKVSRCLKVYARFSTLQYPWTSPTASERLPKTEGKLMVVLSL